MINWRRLNERFRDWLAIKGSFERFPDNYTLTRSSLLSHAADAIRLRRTVDDAIVLVVHFPKSFEDSQAFLERFEIPYEIGGIKLRPEDIVESSRTARGRVTLVLAQMLDRDSLERAVVPVKGFNLSMMVFERHPLPDEDRKLEMFCRVWPYRVRLGYFLSLDDYLLRRCINPTTVQILKQLGLRESELVTSGLISKRLDAVLQRIAANLRANQAAASVEEWFEKNAPNT